MYSSLKTICEAFDFLSCMNRFERIFPTLLFVRCRNINFRENTALYEVFTIHKLYFYFPISDVGFSFSQCLVRFIFFFFFFDNCVIMSSVLGEFRIADITEQKMRLYRSVYSKYTISLLSPDYALLTLCNCVYEHN